MPNNLLLRSINVRVKLDLFRPNKSTCGYYVMSWLPQITDKSTNFASPSDFAVSRVI